MINMMKADLFKLGKSKSIKILFLISLATSIIMLTMAYFISTGKMVKELAELGFLFTDISMINLLSGILAGSIICSDFKNKSFHHAIASGKSRLYIVTSKVLVFLCAVGILILPYAVVTGVAFTLDEKIMLNGLAEAGLMNLIKVHSGTVLSSSGIFKLIGVILSIFLLYMAQVSFCLPFAFLIKKPSVVVGLNYGFSMFFGNLVKYRDSSPIFKAVFDCTPYGGNYIFMDGFSSGATLLKSIIVSLLFIALMIFISYNIFKKMDIK